MTARPNTSDDATISVGVRDDRLCDKFEFLLLARQPVLVADFLRGEGLDPAAAGPDLLRELDRLDAYYRPQDHTQPYGAPPRAVDEPDEAVAGMVLGGRYTLLQKIGGGGMGDVWMAQQTAPVRRTVAVKLIKAGMDTRAVLARFDAERQALAVMDHPNIARVLDGGSTPAGRPYFVMELVKGVPITKFCDERKLTPQQRLELFIPVCQAIQHAHQKGVIHRDIKPGNVLVALYDDKPVVKVIDFGIAKATAQPLTERTLVTGYGAVVGTPEYMSPEQAGFNQLDIDTRSDVYSLGVLLYELLTGTTPVDRKSLQDAALHEVLRIVREVDAPRPSDRLSSSANLPGVAANRGTEPKKLSGQFRGELDWIVLKALEKDRGRRYESALAFAADVQRHLANEVVAARPPTPGYRLQKFVRRNRGPVAAVAAVFLALVAGVVGTTLGLFEASAAKQRESDRANGEREAKENEATQKGLAEANAVLANGNAELARQNEAAAIKERDAKDDALKAEKLARSDEKKARDRAYAALQTFSDDFVERQLAREPVLRDEDKAFMRQIIAEFDAVAAIAGADRESQFFRAAGRARVGVIRYRLGELKEAEASLRDALAIQTKLAADYPDHPDRDLDRHERAKCLNNLSLLLSSTSRVKEAEKTIIEALDIQKKLVADFPDNATASQGLSNSHNTLGNLQREGGKPKEAEASYREALAVQKRLAERFPDRPEFRIATSLSLNNLSLVMRDTGRLKDAYGAVHESLGVMVKLSEQFPGRVDVREYLGSGFSNIGVMFRALNRPKDAETAHKEAQATFRALAADFPARPQYQEQLATTDTNLGVLYRATNRMKEAETVYRESLAIHKRLAADFPKSSSMEVGLTMSYNNLANLFNSLGRLNDAEPLYLEARAILRRLVKEMPNQPDIVNDLANVCTNLGGLFVQGEDYAAAKASLNEGRPHHLAALKANPRNPVYVEYYRNHLWGVATTHAGLLDTTEAVHAAEKLRDLGRDAAIDAFDATTLLCRCVNLAEKHPKLDAEKRKEAAKVYSDAAMEMLRATAKTGRANAEILQVAPGLVQLRDRDDFKELIAELEKTAGKKK